MALRILLVYKANISNQPFIPYYNTIKSMTANRHSNVPCLSTILQLFLSKVIRSSQALLSDLWQLYLKLCLNHPAMVQDTCNVADLADRRERVLLRQEQTLKLLHVFSMHGWSDSVSWIAWWSLLAVTKTHSLCFQTNGNILYHCPHGQYMHTRYPSPTLTVYLRIQKQHNYHVTVVLWGTFIFYTTCSFSP